MHCTTKYVMKTPQPISTGASSLDPEIVRTEAEWLTMLSSLLAPAPILQRPSRRSSIVVQSPCASNGCKCIRSFEGAQERRDHDLDPRLYRGVDTFGRIDRECLLYAFQCLLFVAPKRVNLCDPELQGGICVRRVSSPRQIGECCI